PSPTGQPQSYTPSSNGSKYRRHALASGYTDLAYLKAVPKKTGKVTFRVRAVGHDGQMSAPRR
ncbi:endo-beta-N-acetylglucosaminidase, partial [Cutibacterium acnes]